MTSTAARPVTVRDARPEEGGAVAALLRETYTAFAGELPPGLLHTWLDDVLDPQDATPSSRSSAAHSRAPRGCTPRAPTPPGSPPVAPGSARSRSRRRSGARASRGR